MWDDEVAELREIERRARLCPRVASGKRGDVHDVRGLKDPADGCAERRYPSSVIHPLPGWEDVWGRAGLETLREAAPLREPNDFRDLSFGEVFAEGGELVLDNSLFFHSPPKKRFDLDTARDLGPLRGVGGMGGGLLSCDEPSFM